MNDFMITKQQKEATLVQYTGKDHIVTLPDTFDGTPVTCIGAKAFLSCKYITELTLPSSTTSIENWAFAHMKNLTQLTIPSNPIALGKEVFLDCPLLSAIHISSDASGNPGVPYFFADGIIKLKNMSLFSPDMAASAIHHKEWMAKYDDVLTEFLQTPDDNGFQPVFYGWFNDEDAEVTQRPAYKKARKEDKTKMVLTRLLYPMYLTDSCKKQLEQYLAEQMPMEENFYTAQTLKQITVWQIYSEQYLQDIRYFHVLMQTGCFHKYNIPYLIRDLSQKNPEVVARLLNYQMEQNDTQHSFEEFTL